MTGQPHRPSEHSGFSDIPQRSALQPREAGGPPSHCPPVPPLPLICVDDPQPPPRKPTAITNLAKRPSFMRKAYAIFGPRRRRMLHLVAALGSLKSIADLSPVVI
jgi:hypothetical protein